MKYKKRFLSAILAGTCGLSVTNIEGIDNGTKAAIKAWGITIGGILAVCAGIAAWVKYDSKKRKKEIARRKEALRQCEFSEENQKCLIEDLLKVIPISEEGNASFDKLLTLKSLEEFMRWGNIDIANSNFTLYYLERIYNVLTAHSISCPSLENRLNHEVQIQAGAAVGRNMPTSGVKIKIG